MNEISIEIHCPPKECWQNRPSHYMAKAKVVKAYRAAAHALMLEAMGGSDGWQRGRIHMEFCWPTRHRRDTLNAAGAMKAAIDGIIDAGLLPDDDGEHMEIGGISASLDKDNPRVIISLERLA